jgi:hypothetical protein
VASTRLSSSQASHDLQDRALLGFAMDGDHGDVVKLGSIVDMLEQIGLNPLN